MKLSEVRAIVTGGARGMGAHFVKRIQEEGGKVVFADVGGVDDAAKALDARGIVCDVSKEEDVVNLFNQAKDALGGEVNVLINNAGITRDGMFVKQGKDGGIQAMTKAQWDAVIGVNLTGPFLCAREFASRHIAAGQKDGVIVNMSSISRAGNMGQTNYAAAKAGLVADTVVWAKELSRYGIRVGAIAPGFIRTPMTEGMKPEALEKMVAGIPLKRMGEPEDIYAAIHFMVTCSYFTGRVVEVDGGLVI